MLEETYLNGVSIYENWNWKKECFIIQCRFCGNIWISTCIERCVVCGSGNVFPVPYRDHHLFSLGWLSRHGFPFVEELVK